MGNCTHTPARTRVCCHGQPLDQNRVQTVRQNYTLTATSVHDGFPSGLSAANQKHCLELKPLSPGVAVGRQTLPGLDAAAGHRERRAAAAVQPGQEVFGRVLRRLPAVVSFLQDLSDALFSRLLSCHHTHIIVNTY